MLRYALKQLCKNPGYSVVVIVTLALSIGANTAIFSLVDALLLRPLPYPEPQRVGSLMQRISGPSNMSDGLSEALLLQHAEVGLLATLAGLALLLSSVGIYGLVSNLVNQRTRELGIRMALGCTLQGTMFEASRSGFGATGAGLAGGLLLSSAASKVPRSQLFGVALYDPLTLCAVSALLALVALLAAVLPTLRIAKIDPAETLRTQ